LLRDARVPVLWRPMHEANGRWFGGGAQGPEPFKRMWRMMFERFTNNIASPIFFGVLRRRSH